MPNGVRVVHRQLASTRLVLCAVILDVGSRDEQPGQEGMAHFLEHMVFKGTHRRKAFHILNRVDSVGGELNAYTTKDKTVFHATVAAEYAPRALELLADITLNSIFPPAELEKEKGVVLEEIDMYRDDPEEAVFEDFDGVVYGSHPLGHPILGVKESVQSFSQADVQGFVAQHYTGSRMVVSVVGACTQRQAEGWVGRYFKGACATHTPAQRLPPVARQGVVVTQPRPIQQSHFILGGGAPTLQQPRLHAAAQLLVNYLGGPSMNSRLSLSIRERYGLAYNIQTFYQPLPDAGLWGIYAGCDPQSLARVRRLIDAELRRLTDAPLPAPALARMKRQFIGALLIGQESLFNQLIGQGKDLLDYGRPVALAEAIQAIEELTPEEMLATARALAAPQGGLNLLVLAAQPGA